MKCDICESKATSLHFGAASCKACAAFFRRTVALDIIYECLTGKYRCEVNFERRMACKRCRYDKCIRNNMSRASVKSTRGRQEYSERREEATPPQSNENTNSYPSTSDGFSPSSTEDEDEFRQLAKYIAKIDSNLNKSRRMAFTDSRLLEIFSGVCKMPFEKQHLRPFDYREYKGYQKQEYVMMFNYSQALPDFEKLTDAYQNFLFRVTCGVDFILSTAFYTSQLGLKDNLLIAQDGTYVPMLPLPLLGDEPGTAALFPKKDEFEKYKNLIKPKVLFWQEFMPNYEKLELTFEENALLKAMSCWHFAQCENEHNGREVAVKQTSKLTRSLLRICQDKYGSENGVVKAGNIVLFMSLVVAQVMELISSLRIMSFFEIVEGDPLINEILSTGSLFS